MIRYAYIYWRMVIVFVVGIITVNAHAHAQEKVDVRYADHPTFSRIVFDWLENVSYEPILTDNKLEITFDKTAIPNWGNLRNDPLNFMANPEYRLEGKKLIVTLKVTKPGHLKHFRSDTKIVFDIIGDDETQSQKTIAPSIIQTRVIQSSQLKESEPEEQDEQATENSSVFDSDFMRVKVNSRWDNIRLSYPWQQNVAAAVFVYHNHLWIIFEGKKIVNHEDLEQFYGPRIIASRQINHSSKTILMYDILPNQGIKVQRIKNTWHIDLGNSVVEPSVSIAKNHQRAKNGQGENFFFSVKDAGDVTVVKDPVVGTDIAIVPVVGSSEAVVEAQKFTEFDVLPTAQGIAVQLIADNVKIEKYNNGISVYTNEGLAISRSNLASKLDSNASNSEKLVDFATWAKGPIPERDFNGNKHELLYILSNSTDATRTETRWKLAKFYLANGHVREAFGVLSVMLDDDRDLIENPDFRVALAVANILMNRPEEGIKLLDHKVFLGERDAYLWSAVANSELNNDTLAFENYKKGADILSLHSPEEQIRFLFAAIRSGYKVGDKDFVRSGLSFLRKLPLNAAQFTEVDYWQAQLLKDEGDLLQTEEILKGVVKAGVRQTAAWAKLDLINMDLTSKKIDISEAVDQLEKLRFAWRGGNFELELLSRLGDLYVEQKDFNTGLQTLKLAVTFFKESKKTDELTKQMSQIYGDLFLKGGASVMDPIKAVSLYSDFRELIPLGNDGDNMTRRLADRLVSLDLLEEAAELLDHQVKFRLKGGAQAVVASRLAMIYILDSKPEKAMDILRATHESQIPKDIEDRRKMIEGRALVQLSQYEEAEVMLEEFNNREADKLRSDIYWKSENWKKYIAHENRLLNDRYQDEKPLNDDERLSVLRLSVAYVINDDKIGVKSLRDKYKTHMDNGLYGDTFEVITAERQLTDINVHRLTKSIASVTKLESFMESYKAEFINDVVSN
ncbi:MAG: hypothetical protein K9G26_02645 [Emcibacter sp.]|nr:hypothetical protein [Emcibacter sp.]